MNELSAMNDKLASLANNYPSLGKIIAESLDQDPSEPLSKETIDMFIADDEKVFKNSVNPVNQTI